MARNGQAGKNAADYGREAIAQWVDAARYGARAVAARREAAGKAKEDAGGAIPDGVGAGAPLPIQGSIDVGLPVGAVFDLCTRFEQLPEILDRVSGVEVEDESHFTLQARAGRRQLELEIEIVDEQPEERLDWECTGPLEHSGVLTLHPLAPRLTRLELTVERASEGAVEQVVRLFGLPERALRQELRRFKAVAELWEDGKGYEPAEIGPPPEDEGEEQEPEAA